MAVILFGRPSPVCWTKNQIQFAFAYSLMQTSWKLHLQVVDTNASLVYAEVQYPFTASGGFMGIKLEQIMDALVSYTLPGGFTGQQEQTGSIKHVKLRWRTVMGLNSFSSWTVDTQEYIIVKGGIGHLNAYDEAKVNIGTAFSPAQFYPSANHKFLTWIPSGRLITPDENAWLNYFSNDAANNTKVTYYVYYTDGTSAQINQNLPTSGTGSYLYRYFIIPAGINQCNLDPNNKGVLRYSVIVHLMNATVLSQYDFVVDNRPYYDTMTLHYFNSFGGLETIKFRASIQNSASFEKKEYEQQPGPANSYGRNPYYDSNLRLSWKANTGYLTDEHSAALLDLLNSLHAGMIIGGSWMPLRIKNKDAVYRNTLDRKNNFTIEFETAATFNMLPAELMNL